MPGKQVWSVAQESQAGLSWEEQHLPWPQGALLLRFSPPPARCTDRSPRDSIWLFT